MKSFADIDLFFFAAVMRSDKLKEMCGNRIFPVYRDSTSEKQDKIPYLVVSPGEAYCQYSTKDDGMGQIDTAECGILCVVDGKTVKAAVENLAELTYEVLKAVKSAFDDRIWEEHEDWDFSISNIKPDTEMPEPSEAKNACVFRWINFTCEI